jgi:uncharacterized membrane protein
MINVLYCGDSSANISNLFFQSPFFFEQKGFDVRVWGDHLIKALESDPSIRVTHMPSWVAYKKFPTSLEELGKYDVIILSDVENVVLTLYEQFFPSAPEQHLTLPNRPKLIVEFVERGGAFIMAGGWLSFTGRMGIGGWHKTPVAKILPVEMLGVDDEMETPEGAVPLAVKVNHPIMKGIDWNAAPPFLGYNKTRLKPKATLLATITEEKDPFIAVWDFKKGRTMAFMSDPVLHWGYNFIRWAHYSQFWTQAIHWLTKR